MLGYHDSPNCAFDLHSPNPARWGNNAIENRAFSPYCVHQQEIENIVDQIVKQYFEEETVDYSLINSLNEEDLEDIINILSERYNIIMNIVKED